MGEFHHVQNATWGPTACIFCGDFAGPFVDTCVDLDVYGHVWVCASSETRSGCVHQLAREDGMIPREELEAVARTLQQRIEDLTMELEAALSNRVVPLDDVIEMIGKEPSHV
jgi:hypothetical protein